LGIHDNYRISQTIENISPQSARSALDSSVGGRHEAEVITPNGVLKGFLNLMHQRACQRRMLMIIGISLFNETPAVDSLIFCTRLNRVSLDRDVLLRGWRNDGER
jgi:hypothetical protein